MRGSSTKLTISRGAVASSGEKPPHNITLTVSIDKCVVIVREGITHSNEGSKTKIVPSCS